MSKANDHVEELLDIPDIPSIGKDSLDVGLLGNLVGELGTDLLPFGSKKVFFTIMGVLLAKESRGSDTKDEGRDNRSNEDEVVGKNSDEDGGVGRNSEEDEG